MKDLIAKHIHEWRHSRLSPLAKELAIAVLMRAAQGMNDEDLCRYLDYRKRGCDPDSVQWRLIENTKASLLREDSRLAKGVREIREALTVIETRRKEQQQAMLAVAGDDYDRFFDVWKDEQRYKNSLIPPWARGGNIRGRRRRKPVKGGKIDTMPLDVVIAKHNEYLAKKRELGIPM